MKSSLYFLLLIFTIQAICIESPKPVIPLYATGDTIIQAILRDDLDAVNRFTASGINLDAGYHEAIHISTGQTTFGRSMPVNKTMYKRNTHQNTALIYAAQEGKLALVKRLLEAGADPNKQNWQRHTALTLCNKHYDVFKTLLENKANPNIKTFQGNTALIYSAMTRSFERVKLLLDHGADASITNDLGFSTHWYAQEAGREFVEVLLAYSHSSQRNSDNVK